VAGAYHNLGGGGLDFLAVSKVLRDWHYKGRAIFDFDTPRNVTTASTPSARIWMLPDDSVAHNINHLRDVLGVKLPPPLDEEAP
jgi:hypothetical protein